MQPARPGDPSGAHLKRLCASSAPLGGRHPFPGNAAREHVLWLGDEDRDRRGRWEDTDRHGGQGNRNKCGGQRESPPPPPCAAAARRALCRGCRTLHLAPQVLSPLGDSGLAPLGTLWTAQVCACVHVCGACAAHSCRACQGVPPAYTDADGVHRRQEEAAGNLGKGAVSGGRLCSAVAPACAPIS